MSLTDKLVMERRARLAAERKLELKSRELFEANRKLSQHALELSGKIIEQREEVAQVRNEAEALKDRNQQTQAQLERAEKLAEIHERRLWDSVEAISDGFAVFDQQDRLIAANSAWLALFDYSEVIQPGIPYLEMIRFAAKKGIFDIGDMTPSNWLADMLDRWDRPDIPEVTIRLWNGQYFRLLDQRSRDGDMVCLAVDTTVMKRREEELREARSRAEAANRAKSAFLANMSHELRTPMNGVVAMVDLLLEGDLDEEQRLYLRTIRSSGESLLSIINDVLDFSKLEAEKMQLRPEPFDMERMLHEVLTLVAPMARDRGLELHVDYDLFLPTKLLGDPGRIRQVLTNLIGNAVKFTEEGHVFIRVVGIESDGDNWQIHVTVEDTGIGIASDMQEHIFDSFAQEEQERNRAFEGTGLGLAISREIIARMGGQIWVESEKGKGSCFGFRISLPCGEENRHVPQRLADGLAKAMMVGGGDLDQEILSRQLRQLGMDVHCVPSGSAALAEIGDGFRPQILLIDERLSDATGLELAGAVRLAGLHSATVLLCADKHVNHPSEAFGTVDAVLGRPILRSELFRTLAALTAHRDSVPQAEAPAPNEPSETPAFASCRHGALHKQDVGRAMRVLAAEDNRTNQFVFQKLVKTLDIDLKIASNGQEAIELYKDFQPDLIFMDISMPGTDGKQATREIRRLEAGKRHVPIVAMTAHALLGDKEDILAAGLDHYLTKPMQKSLISAIIREARPSGCRAPGTREATVAE
ncbi:ATP-binding protein [Aliiruegeria lutimaris]|uniref:Sensory/regulatory protein RpfC n=1 Tax=Aliiruegeria lutimaris TaxID=571298 RepID=A0A1G8QAX6_9RHOB|nr:ATP-binding protein [Aliiruegeria lutimaris]SDJ01625.1 histidine kinase [Aliiruegeria lutimaris]